MVRRRHRPATSRLTSSDRVRIGLIRSAPGSLIYSLFAIAIAVPVVIIASSGAAPNAAAAVVFVVWEAVVLLYYWICRKRIRMASVMYGRAKTLTLKL